MISFSTTYAYMSDSITLSFNYLSSLIKEDLIQIQRSMNVWKNQRTKVNTENHKDKHENNRYVSITLGE